MSRPNNGSTSIDNKSGSRFDLRTRSDLVKFTRSDLVIFVLVFALLLAFSLHNFDSIGQDIGRHLKVGEIIWQTGSVPKTNLFSFTEPNFPFINHHWLSEVLFYKIHGWFGFTGLILTKVFLLLATFLLLFSIVKKKAKFWPILVSFLLSLFVLIHRTEVRPEIFSFLILAFFLWVLFKEKYKQPKAGLFSLDYLWFLPLAELLWVNLHIYFFIGPFLLLAFLLDQLLGKSAIHPLENSRGDSSRAKAPTEKLLLTATSRGSRVGRMADLPMIFLIFLLTSAATLINPNGLSGALSPFHILKEYGYSIVENQTLSFLSVFNGLYWTIFAFKLAVGTLVAAFLLTIKKTRQRIFEIIISVFFIYAGFKMLRNLPLFALSSFPILSLVLTDISNWFNKKRQSYPQARLSLAGKLSTVLKWGMAAVLIFAIFFVASNRYYRAIQSPKAFGFSVPNGLERAVQFVKDNKVQGPMFNNFDPGGYLIWRLYPEQKVFVDNRPEAYSVKFFKEIYKPMQEDPKKWQALSGQYGINFVFFAHTDVTPWGFAFVNQIIKNPDWKMVYVNEEVMIFVKDNQNNAALIAKFLVTENNFKERLNQDLRGSNEKALDLNLVMSRVFYNVKWRGAALYFADQSIKLDPQNSRAYLYKGLLHAYYTDKENQRLAAASLEKALGSGLKDDYYNTVLGIVYMNLGRLDEAKSLFSQAVKINPNNKQAKEFLDKFFKDSGLNVK